MAASPIKQSMDQGRTAGYPPSEAASVTSKAADVDVEKAASSSGLASPGREANVIDWELNDPGHPLNWPRARIVTNFSLIMALTLLSTLGSCIFTPAVPDIVRQFESDSAVLEALVVSVYLLGYASGPLLTAPLSELYGRVPVYHASNIGFICFTVGCALSPNFNALIVFRFFAGVFGATPVTNGGGSIADMIPPVKRGRAMSIYVLGPLVGPVIGPIMGGFLAESEGWPWCFWLVAIVSGAVEIAMLAFMDETYPPTLLRMRAKKLRKETGNDQLRTVHDSDASSPGAVFKRALVRPLKLLVRSPILNLVSFWVALAYGYVYIVFSSISPVYEATYGFKTDLVGLVYIGIGIGTFAGMGLYNLTADKYIQRKSAEADEAARAAGRAEEGLRSEYRLFLYPIGVALLPIGMFIYGWPAEYQVQWVVPIIGTAILGMGLNILLMSSMTYLVDVFKMYAASALAASTVLRSLAGGLLPMAALPLYNSLGYGWGNSLLAFIAIAFAPTCFVILRYGEFLRKKYEIKDL